MAKPTKSNAFINKKNPSPSPVNKRKQADLSYDDQVELIKFVKAHPELWLKSDALYKDVDFKVKTWPYFIRRRGLKCNVDQIKILWSNLRQRFVSAWKKWNHIETYPTDEKWPHYKSLMFLIDDLSADISVSIGLVHSLSDSEPETQMVTDDEDSKDLNYSFSESEEGMLEENNDKNMKHRSLNENRSFCNYLESILYKWSKEDSLAMRHEILDLIYYRYERQKNNSETKENKEKSQDLIETK